MTRTPDQIIADVIGFGPDDSAQWCNRNDLHKIIHAVQGEFVDQGVEQAEHIRSLEQTIHKHGRSSPRMEELLVRYQQWLQIVEYDPAARVAEAHIDYMLQGQYIPRPGTVVTSGFYAAAQQRENASATKEASERGMAFLVHGVHVSADNVFVLSVPDTKGPISDMRKAKAEARATIDLQRQLIERNDELVRTRRQLAASYEAEHAMSDSYVRIRQILGATKAPSSKPDELFTYVEQYASESRLLLRGAHNVMDTWNRRAQAAGFADMLDMLDMLDKQPHQSLTLKVEADSSALVVTQEALTLLADVGVELGPVHAMTERIRQFLSRVAGS